jgi:hypothetical protein
MKPGEQSAASSDYYEPITSRAKTDAVMRLLKGESLDAICQELGVSVRRVERWKTRFVDAGTAELARRTDVPSDSWMARNAKSIQQWIWLILALIAVIGVLVVLMQRSAQE